MSDNVQKRPFSGPSTSAESEAKVIQCSLCDMTFSKAWNYKRHLMKKHPEKQVNSTKEFRFVCELCCTDRPRKFNQVCHLNHHMKKVHGVASETKIHHCIACAETFEGKQYLIKHYNRDHSVEVEEMTFPTLERFLSWKETVERDTCAKYVKPRGDRAIGLFKHHYYECHRSGKYVSKGAGKRHMKMQGTRKMNGTCPASMKVVEGADGACSVIFVKTHLGHEMDLGHLSLSSAEKATLAKKISEKVPFDAILDEVRDSVSPTSGLQRIHLLTKKDLHNLDGNLNLTSSAVKHKDDGTSLDIWVREMQSDGDDCILLYKPQGVEMENVPLKEEDFALGIMNLAQSEMLLRYGSDCICIDSTHGVNSYDFQLVTLLVLDDIRQGFPCAFLISNRTDQTVLSLFFEKVKLIVGDIAPKVFMSDMAESFYNGWVQVMTNPEMRLFCAWHVDKAWRNNLKKVKEVDKQVMVYKLLRTLMEETDKFKFEVIMSQAIEALLNDPDCVEFGKYFCEQYSSNVTTWAYCFRICSGINTNMHIERMHRTIKYIYFHGKKIKRLDKSVHAIMKFVRDKVFDRLVVLHKGKVSSKLQVLRDRHRSSVNIRAKIEENEIGWNVLSSNGLQNYFVQENDMNCNCQLVCDECGTCIHKYRCSCIDASVKWNMCKHIHQVCQYQIAKGTFNSFTESDHSNDGNGTKSGESCALVNHLCSAGPSCEEPMYDRREKMKQKLSELANSLLCIKECDFSSSELDFLENKIDILEPVIGTMRSNVAKRKSTTTSVQNIVPQRRLFSTKKLRKTSKPLLSKPTVEEKAEICSLLIPNE